MFNNELDLLELRLEFLWNQVDHFIIVESPRTLSGTQKPLYFFENKQRYRKFLSKIIYLEAPARNDLLNWDYEKIQRNHIKYGLRDCHDEDIIFISDVDEILNIKEILKYKNLRLPAVIELPVCYYYFNLVSDDIFRYNLVSKYSMIKDWHLGIRNYVTLTTNLVPIKNVRTGWHFSYLFGENIEHYINKIESFSHQEYNIEYYKDNKRLLTSIRNGQDIFERPYNYYFYSHSFLKEIWPSIEILGLNNLYKKRNLKKAYKTFFRIIHVWLYEQKTFWLDNSS